MELILFFLPVVMSRRSSQFCQGHTKSHQVTPFSILISLVHGEGPGFTYLLGHPHTGDPPCLDSWPTDISLVLKVRSSGTGDLLIL